jgi:hypothetical protein
VTTLAIRASNATKPNDRLSAAPAREREGNAGWLRRLGAADGILLLGGSSAAHLRLRSAQAALRNDLTPSHWSLAGILTDGDTFLSAPLEMTGDVSAIPPNNGIRECKIADYDDPIRYPNIARLVFAAQGSEIRDAAARVGAHRALVDIPALIVAWLAQVWGVDDCNPLASGRGMPSAAFVEAAHQAANIELTPGLASGSSCPEAIWQTAKWWQDYYADAARVAAVAPRAPRHAAATVPSGTYLVRQSLSPAGEVRPVAPHA